MQIKRNKFYIGDIKIEDIIQKYGSPLYIYDQKVIEEKFNNLKDKIEYPFLKIHYAVKANSNTHLLKLLRSLGSNVEVVSEGLARLSFKAGFKPSQIIYTCNGAEKEELDFIMGKKIQPNLDSVNQVEYWGKKNPGSKIGIRLNLNMGSGHHEHTTTGGSESKFGIHISEIKNIKRIVKKYNLIINGLQQHIGSGIPDPKTFEKAAHALLKISYQFEDLEYIDLGGGLDIPYRPKDKEVDIKGLSNVIDDLMSSLSKMRGKDLNLIIEPGRYLVAQSGVLIAKVTDIKTHSGNTFVSINTGMNHLIRSAMYSSYHELVNISKPKDRSRKVNLVGNVCESSDVFAKNRSIRNPQVDDLVAILDAGAYGYSMSSLYNGRPKPAEILVSKDKVKLIRERTPLDDILESF